MFILFTNINSHHSLSELFTWFVKFVQPLQKLEVIIGWNKGSHENPYADQSCFWHKYFSQTCNHYNSYVNLSDFSDGELTETKIGLANIIHEIIYEIIWKDCNHKSWDHESRIKLLTFSDHKSVMDIHRFQSEFLKAST